MASIACTLLVNSPFSGSLKYYNYKAPLCSQYCVESLQGVYLSVYKQYYTPSPLNNQH